MTRPRSLRFMFHFTLAILLAAGCVAMAVFCLVEMSKPIPSTKVVDAVWMQGVRRHANGIYKEGL